MEASPRFPHLIFKVIHNSATLMGGELFYRFANFLASILVARSLGSEGYGQFSFIYVYISFFEAFVQFGLNPILVRELAQNQEKAPRVLGNAIWLRIALIFLAWPAAWLLIRRMGYPFSVRQGVLLAYFQLFLTLRPIFETVFRINLMMIYPALWNGVRALLTLAFVAVVTFWFPFLPAFILAYLASGLLGLTGLALFSRRYVKLDLRFDPKILSHLVRESAPILVSAYLTLLYYRIDIFMLSFLRDFSEVGLYTTATRITETLNLIATSIFASFFPLLSRSFKENRREFNELVQKAFHGLLLLGLPLALGGSLVGRDLILLFFGSSFASAGATLVILSWHTFFCFLSGLLANILIGCGRQTVDMWISFFLVFVNISLNFFLIPTYRFNGAALATVVTELLGVMIYFFFARRDGEIQLSFPFKAFQTVLKINLPFLILCLLIRYSFKLPVLVFISLAVFIYGALLFLFGEISWSQVRDYGMYLTGETAP